MTAPRPPALECRKVSAGHRDASGAAKAVVTGVDLVLPEGGRLLFVGRSGSGKSTLLRALCRLDEPLGGVILHDGTPLPSLDPLALRRSVALVPQKPVVFEGTVRDNLCVRGKGDPAPAPERLATLLREVNLSPELLDRSADSLSLGEQQRLCLCRALVRSPRVLLLDEPTSSLDPRSLGVVADLALSLVERYGLALVVATHQLELVKRLDAPALLFAEGSATRVENADSFFSFFGGG